MTERKKQFGVSTRYDRPEEEEEERQDVAARDQEPSDSGINNIVLQNQNQVYQIQTNSINFLEDMQLCQTTETPVS